MIEMVFAVLLITTADGKIIEHTPIMEGGLGACLEMKRTVAKSIKAVLNAFIEPIYFTP